MTNREGIGDVSAPAAGQHRPGGGVSAGGCFASVMLDEQLWQSLAAINGKHHQVAWVHGCILDHGHDGEHGAPAYQAGGQTYWLHWGENQRPHLNIADEPHLSGQNSRPRVESPDRARHASEPTTAHPSPASPPAQPDPPKPTSDADALWAIAAAIEHLANVIATAFNSTETPGRHRRGNTGDQP